MKTTTMRNIWGAVLGLGLAACGTTDVQEEEPPQQQEQGLVLEAGCTQLAANVADHTCHHVNNGPALTVNASATENFAGTSPNINTTHTYYTVNLTGSGSSRVGTVKFKPAKKAADSVGTQYAWAFYRNNATPLVVKSEDGTSTISPVLTHSVAVSGCALTTVSVYNLTGNTTYQLVFGPTSSSSVGIGAERVEDLRNYYFQDADGDGYGNTNIYKLTACVPPANYVLDDTDCNDSNASVHPGAGC
ncbi:hypothetical protein [Stigmatella aurantiaca]|uniref:Conserved uncharacterized protein n=1 Tax=Stigmatella aurantiaca (strain DW4/3-1) TaxID=378806 RepID=E3FDE0_STIAD|nr:hypothetical protein [Stigmatella aurantiaca]ADO68819.1 conserved uncharacterized protein [Stigmatella aurantiaca DW4/3-1]